jgi:hypothetical protein
MIKKILLLSVVISQLTISCSKEDNPIDPSEQNLADQIAEIVKLPYSSLKPDQQKTKLEAEANDMLLKMDKSKTSGAIEAVENLGNLLSINTVDILDGKNDNQIEDVLNVSGVYGIYTWNNAEQIWVKTTSTTELKFIFPAKKGLTTNNATLSSKSTSSDIKVYLDDLDQFYLPTSVDAALTIDNKPAATFSVNAKYSNGKETPDESSYKMVLNDGYTFEISGKRLPIEAKSSFSFEGKNIVEFNSGSTANIDELLKDNYLNKYLGTANGLIKLMDNFVIVANVNIEGLTNDKEALKESLIYPDYNSNTYYTDLNIYYKKYSEEKVISNNKNSMLILVSKKDGTKIAEVIQKPIKGYSYYAGNTLVQKYDEVLYLKFNDNTEVEMSLYFSTGFDALKTKFEDFLKSFERN